MIRDGLILLINSNSAVASILGGNVGGWLGSLPKDAPMPNWYYQWVSDRAATGLLMPGRGGFTSAELRVCCVGSNQAAPMLAAAVRGISGFQGVLPDRDGTRVDSIIYLDMHDGEEDPASRTFAVMVEFHVNYYA